MMEKTLQELGEFVGGTVEGDSRLIIRGVAGIKEAEEGQITFLGNPKYVDLLPHTKASAVILSTKEKKISLPSIRTDNPYLAFARLLHLFYVKPYRATGIDPHACIDPSATLGQNVSVFPHAVIGKDVVIGSDVQIYSGVFIGDCCRIGEGTILYPNVSIYHHCRIGSRVIIHAGSVIGSDGFGYIWDGQQHYKIPQVGRVIIEDDVEIGAETAVDRGTIGDTIIRRGTKIDNLVQIAHNVEIGKLSVLVSQSGMAGSAKLGDGVILGGQSAIAGHLTVGDNTKVAAKSAVTKSVPANSIMAGTMAQPLQEWRKSVACVRRLPRLLEKIKKLENKIQDLEDRLQSSDKSP